MSIAADCAAGRNTAQGGTTGQPDGFSARSGVPGTVKGVPANVATARLVVGCGGRRRWFGDLVACGGGSWFRRCPVEPVEAAGQERCGPFDMVGP